MSITIDPEFKALIPPLAPEEYSQLESNLKAEGCRDPLVMWQGVIIDGHNRFEICTRLGIGFEKISKPFKDRSQAIEWIIRNQFGRRNLDAYQRTKLALRLEETIAARAKAHVVEGGRAGGKGPQNSANPLPPIETREEIAKPARRTAQGEAAYRVKEGSGMILNHTPCSRCGSREPNPECFVCGESLHQPEIQNHERKPTATDKQPEITQRCAARKSRSHRHF